MKKKKNEKLKVKLRFKDDMTKEESQNIWFRFFDFMLAKNIQDTIPKNKVKKG